MKKGQRYLRFFSWVKVAANSPCSSHASIRNKTAVVPKANGNGMQKASRQVAKKGRRLCRPDITMGKYSG